MQILYQINVQNAGKANSVISCKWSKFNSIYDFYTANLDTEKKPIGHFQKKYDIV